MGDEREAILARRRRLIALALAGGAVTTACTAGPCLSLDSPPPDAGVTAGDTPDDTNPDTETDAP